MITWQGQVIKLVIFDFDDTLIDNREVDYRSFAQTSRSFGGVVPERRKISYWRHLGLNASQIWRKLYPRQKEQQKKLSLLRQKLLQNGVVYRKYTKLFSGVIKLLRYLQRQGAKVAIVTRRSQRSLIELVLNKFGIGNYIDDLYTGHRMTTTNSAVKRLKQLGIQTAMRRFMVKPNEVLAVGDDRIDFKAASELKINFVMIKNGYKRQEFMPKRFTLVKLYQVLKTTVAQLPEEQWR